MRIALITTPPGVRSGIGDYTRHLLPSLRERAEVVGLRPNFSILDTTDQQQLIRHVLDALDIDPASLSG